MRSLSSFKSFTKQETTTKLGYWTYEFRQIFVDVTCSECVVQRFIRACDTLTENERTAIYGHGDFY